MADALQRRRRSQGDPKIAIAYIRASTDEQHLGPEAQRRDIERWAEREHVRIVRLFEDLGVSGGAPLDRRLGLLAALDAIAPSQAGLLVAAKRDRLARDIFVMATVERLAERQGARAIAIDDDTTSAANDPNAFLMRSIKDAFAQFERLTISARTRAALAVKRSRGERTGGVPLGQRVLDGGIVLMVDEVESAALARIVELRGRGLSIRAIATALNDEHVPARGARWHKTTVERALRRAQR